MPPVALSGIILAGGSSRRLGQDKSLLRLWGEQGPTLLEATIAHLAAICDEVLVVGTASPEWPALGTRVAPDRYPGGGALGGIYTGLLEASAPFSLAVACDMPFLDEALLRYMAGLPRDYDVLIPRVSRSTGEKNEVWLEPLHAIYHQACLGPIRQVLERGERQIIAFFPYVRVRYLEGEDLTRFDPAGRSFLNINTPEDLARARRLLGSY